MTDIEGKTYDIGPGSVIYAPPGIASSHSWEIKEQLQLISFRATTDSEKTISFDVDSIYQAIERPLDHLEKRQATNFKKSLY